MTDPDDVAGRLDRLESLIERQQETIDAQRRRIDELEADCRTPESEHQGVSRRTALKAGGLAGLLALRSGAASAGAKGRCGTEAGPLAAIHAVTPVRSSATSTAFTTTDRIIGSGSQCEVT